MRRLFGLAAVVVVLSALAPSAQAGTRFSIVGAGDMPSITETTPPGGRSLKGAFGFGGGLLIGLPLGSHMEFETGGVYSQLKMDQTIGAVATTLTGWMIHVPLVFNYWLNPHIAITAGGFMESGVGSIDSTGAPATQSYASFGISNLNYGVEGGLGFAFPMGGAALIIDGRYQLGLKDLRINTASGSTKISNMVGLVGVRFGGGK